MEIIEQERIESPAPRRREPFVPPTLEVYTFAVERGFAESKMAAISRMESISEIGESGGGGKDGTGGENYHGEWF